MVDLNSASWNRIAMWLRLLRDFSKLPRGRLSFNLDNGTASVCLSAQAFRSERHGECTGRWMVYLPARGVGFQNPSNITICEVDSIRFTMNARPSSTQLERKVMWNCCGNRAATRLVPVITS